jgi:hypothetical protein
MKIACAWCGSVIRVCCDHCGAPLIATTVLGASLPFAERDAMTCMNGLTPILYTGQAIAAMPISHGICKNCKGLPEATRDALLAERRKANAQLPTPSHQAEIIQAANNPNRHEEETRSLDRILSRPHDRSLENRGPKGVSRATTRARSSDTKKSDGDA